MNNKDDVFQNTFGENKYILTHSITLEIMMRMNFEPINE